MHESIIERIARVVQRILARIEPRTKCRIERRDERRVSCDTLRACGRGEKVDVAGSIAAYFVLRLIIASLRILT